MKHAKIITLLAAAAVTLSAGSVAANATQSVEAAKVKKSKQNKYSFAKAYTLPKSWRGKWYSTSYITPSPLNIHKSSMETPWSGQHVKAVKVGKVKGTNKYPWQMSSAWKLKNSDVFTNMMRITTKKMRGNKWIVASAADEKSTAMGFAYTLKMEKLNGKKQQVLFEALTDTGEVTNQYFRSRDLAKKYANTHFKGMTYRKINPR